MKTTIISLSIASLLSLSNVFAQDKTTVTATNSEISDNLDLRAVASLFGESENLADFEQRLNDPKTQISNLDLNEDNQVDYLRVIETIEGNAHIIVIQSVLGKDTFQDVATVEVQRDAANRVQVQVVGDVYMYGSNYIYEPVYVTTPMIYASFWVGNYRPYYSTWYWGYYPTYYYFWEPFPIFRYRSHIGLCINPHYQYNYVNYRRCEVAYASYRGRRGNGYEARYPNRSFQARRGEYSNRYELDKTRNLRTVGTRGETMETPGRGNDRDNSIRNGGTRNEFPRGNGAIRTESPRTTGVISTDSPRTDSPRTNGVIRTESPRTDSPRTNGVIRTESPRNVVPQGNNNRSYETPRSTTPRSVTPRQNSAPRSNGLNTGGGRASGGARRG
jgi:hypothetical protein